MHMLPTALLQCSLVGFAQLAPSDALTIISFQGNLTGGRIAAAHPLL